jgi:hypothetical protein
MLDDKDNNEPNLSIVNEEERKANKRKAMLIMKKDLNRTKFVQVIQENILYNNMTRNIAIQVGKILNGIVEEASGNGWKISIANGKQTILVRVMNPGSGKRVKPYFRISVNGKGALTAEGKFSSDRELTHIDIDNTSDAIQQILNIINLYRGK